MFGLLLEEVLNESVASVDKITKAINDHTKVLVTYKPVTKGREHATGTRLIGIFAYGQTKASNDCVRVYEYAGDTATFVPGWKLLRLDQFLSWKPTGQTFNEPPDKKFNPDGDNTMSVVFKVAKFDDDVTTNDSSKGPKTAEDLFLTPTEKKLKKNRERLQNQFNNPITISDFKAKRGMEDYKGGKDEYSVGPKTADDVKPQTEPKTPSYKDEVSQRFQGLRDKIKNAPKIDLTKFEKPKPGSDKTKEKELSDLRKKLGDTSEPIKVSDLNNRLKQKTTEPEKEQTPSYKDEVSQRFQGLRDKLKNAPKIDLSQFDKDKKKRK